MVLRLMADEGRDPQSSDEDVARVREVLARELETINSYEAHARATKSEALRDFFMHLAAEEKEHVAEAVLLLRQLDAGQERFFTRTVPADHFAPKSTPAPVAPSSAAGMSDLSAGLHEPPVTLEPRKIVYGQEAPPTSLASPFTVGSLRGSR